MSTATSTKNNVVVCVRIRPRNEKELAAGMPVSFDATEDGSNVTEIDENGDMGKAYAYDHVFGPDCSNQYIFQSVGVPLVDAALDGFNTVLFMYGQTSSGKTFTLFGGGSIAGLVDHSMEHVYHRIMNSVDAEYVIKMTYAELYNEELKDLLATTPNENLKIIDDPALGPQIQNITEAPFTTAADVKRLLEEGEARRHFGVTNMNAHSSRSHVLVRLHIETRKVPYKPTQPLRSSWGRDKPTTLSTLNLVDLAGSERAGKSGTSGQSLKEGSFINKSLLTLGTVISNLSEGKGGQHIPYRNSKLTRLLASALGGNAKTTMITCISPASGNIAESQSTLRFATRAKRIVNQVQRNEIKDMKTMSSQLAMQTAELEELRQKLELSRQLGFVPDNSEAGETLKDRAVAASRNWRSMKFLMSSGPKMVKALKKAGLQHIAKKIQSDMKSAISGSREISEIIEEHSSIIYSHLQHETKLVKKMEDLQTDNSTEGILAPLSQLEGGGNIGDGDDEQHHQSDDESEEDVYTGFGADPEEVQLQLDQAYMEAEDLRSAASAIISTLQHEKKDLMANERSLMIYIEECRAKILDRQEVIKKLTSSEAQLNHTADELKKKLVEEQSASFKHAEKLQSHVNALELTLGDRDSQIASLQGHLISKEAEVERLRSIVDTTTKELTSANIARKTAEEEVVKVRNEMRGQMDRLRSNMHCMLKQGGEEVLFLQNQNSQLQKECDSLRDQLEMAILLKKTLEEEAAKLKVEIDRKLDNEKLHIEEMTSVREQVFKMNQKMQELRSELAHASSSFQVADANNVMLRAQLQEEKRDKEAQLDKKKEDFKRDKSEWEKMFSHLEVQIGVKTTEVVSLRQQLEEKRNIIQKLENTIHFDSTRLEKKYHQQMKLHEDIVNEQMLTNQSYQQTITGLMDKNKALAQKVADLQASIDSVNSFLEVNGIHLNDDDEGELDQAELAVENLKNIRRSALSITTDFDEASVQSFNMSAPYSMTPTSASAFSTPANRRSPSKGGKPPMDPVLLAESYYREKIEFLNKVFDCVEPESMQFKNLRQGLATLIALTNLSIAECGINWRCLMNEWHVEMAEHVHSEIEVDSLRSNLEALRKGNTQHVTTKETYDRIEEKYQQRTDALEEEIMRLNHAFSELVATEHAERDQLDQYDCIRNSLQLQIDKLKHDNDWANKQMGNLSRANEELSSQVENLAIAYTMLQSNADLLHQELGILEAEREEFYRRFLKQAPPASKYAYFNSLLTIDDDPLQPANLLDSKPL